MTAIRRLVTCADWCALLLAVPPGGLVWATDIYLRYEVRVTGSVSGDNRTATLTRTVTVNKHWKSKDPDLVETPYTISAMVYPREAVSTITGGGTAKKESGQESWEYRFGTFDEMAVKYPTTPLGSVNIVLGKPNILIPYAFTTYEMSGASDPNIDPSALKGLVRQAWDRADRAGGGHAGGRKFWSPDKCWPDQPSVPPEKCKCVTPKVPKWVPASDELSRNFKPTLLPGAP